MRVMRIGDDKPLWLRDNYRPPCNQNICKTFATEERILILLVNFLYSLAP